MDSLTINIPHCEVTRTDVHPNSPITPEKNAPSLNSKNIEVDTYSPLGSVKSTRKGSLIGSSGSKNSLVKASSPPVVGLFRKPQVGSEVVGTARRTVPWPGTALLLFLSEQAPPPQDAGPHSTTPVGSSSGTSPHPLSRSFFRMSLKAFFFGFDLLPSGLNFDDGDTPYSLFKPSTSR